MIQTDPASQYRNDCIKFFVEAYNIDNWTAFQWAGSDCITGRFHDGASFAAACNEYITEVGYSATTR